MHGVHPKLDLFGVEVQVEEFPAPLCDRCGVPKWLNKRISYAGPPYSQVRLGFVCLTCGSKTKLPDQEPRPLLR
jgi:hypothetical protein